MLKWNLETEWIPKGLIVVNLLERYTSIIQSRKKRSKREFRLKAHIEDCEISNFMLDFGSDVNIVPTNTWKPWVSQISTIHMFNCEWPINIVSTIL